MPKIIPRKPDEMVPVRMSIRHEARQRVKSMAVHSDVKTEDAYAVLIEYALNQMDVNGIRTIGELHR